MNKQDKNKKNHFNILNNSQALHLLSNLVKKKVDILCWNHSSSNEAQDDLEQVQEIFTIENFNEETFAIELKRKKNSFFSLDTGSKLTNKMINFKIEYGKLTYFSFAKLNYEKESLKYYIILDLKSFYKAQQRSNYRLTASVIYKILIKINSEVYKVVDVSAGGACIEFTNQNKFSCNEVYNECIVYINDNKFSISQMKILKTWQNIDSNGRTKFYAGTQFTKVNQTIENRLAHTINMEARAMEIQRKLSGE